MGRLILIEGPDRIGKSTQADLLARRLRAEGYAVIQRRFPSQNWVGQELRRFLKRERELTPEAATLLFEADRFMELASIEDNLREFDFVVMDRFWRTGVAYSGARGEDMAWSLAICRPYALRLAEHEVLIRLYRPSYVPPLREDWVAEIYDDQVHFQNAVQQGFRYTVLEVPPAVHLPVDATQETPVGRVYRDPVDLHFAILDGLKCHGVLPK